MFQCYAIIVGTLIEHTEYLAEETKEEEPCSPQKLQLQQIIQASLTEQMKQLQVPCTAAQAPYACTKNIRATQTQPLTHTTIHTLHTHNTTLTHYTHTNTIPHSCTHTALTHTFQLWSNCCSIDAGLSGARAFCPREEAE